MTMSEIMKAGGAVWLVLMVLSVANFLVGEDLGLHGHTEIAILMAIAFVKARLIIRHFMEVKEAPLPLRIVFDIWCILAPVALVSVVILGERGLLS